MSAWVPFVEGTKLSQLSFSFCISSATDHPKDTVVTPNDYTDVF